MLKIPVIRGMIDRRILVNYRVDLNVAEKLLPPPFEPLEVKGYAIIGVCLIRLKQLRPAFVPNGCGIASENAAHRFAVRWAKDGKSHEGVFIPRRDTNSRLITLAGGRLFPGVHHHAAFSIEETERAFSFQMQSDDGVADIALEAEIADELPADSLFVNLQNASQFFQRGSLGYSASYAGSAACARFDGLELRCKTWQMKPLRVTQIASSYFADHAKFPPSAIEFDSAFLMKGIEHEWHGRGELCCDAGYSKARDQQAEKSARHSAAAN